MTTNPSATLAALADQVRDAADARRPLRLRGAGSKEDWHRPLVGELLDLGRHAGIVSHEPAELVITARAGTPLAEVESALAARGQHLGFEPPRAAAGATLGGAIATGLSGPGRPYLGAARDCVLGVRLLSVAGDVLRFGGQVMKNVAGFDVSRLMTGAWGTLGPIVEVSLRVLPLPEIERTAVWRVNAQDALARMTAMGRQPWPVTGMCHDGSLLHVRLAGAPEPVTAALAALAPDEVVDEAAFWMALRDRSLPFFDGSVQVWRVVVPPAAPPLPIAGDCLLDWGGAQRWLRTAVAGEAVLAAATAAGGHARLVIGPRDALGAVRAPAALSALQQRVKASFDPHDIFNRGLMCAAGA